MVALTPAYALPYQQGGDDPCESAEVWCELAGLANTAMTATKALLDRVSDRAHMIDTGTDSFRFRRTMERRKKG